MTRLFVGNLAPATRAEDLRALFATYGPVSAANVVMDRASGESKGFGFVELRVPSHAVAALRGLNGSELMGRSIVVGRAHFRGRSAVAAMRHPVGRSSVRTQSLVGCVCGGLT